jgi:uncharacterized NAD(P)/FAD-binding protein YdhS
MAAPDCNGGNALRLVIIGGGFTGAVFAINVIRATAQPLDIVVIEPRDEIGRGIAYSTEDLAHRTNAPCNRMALFKADSMEATRWCFEKNILPDAKSDDGQGLFYIPRKYYGQFVSDVFRTAVRESSPRVSFRHMCMSASGVARGGEEWIVTISDGSNVCADLVAFCFGHAIPAAPCPIGADVEQSPKFISNPWVKDSLTKIESTDSVLIVGTGLTMADVVMSLHERGHTGNLTAISRRGLTPNEHGVFCSDIDIFEGKPAPTTALGLLRQIRRQVRDVGPALGWQPVVDSLRAKLPTMWRELPCHEQRRVLRRLLPFWEVHRFRIAPQVGAVLLQLQQTLQLAFHKAALKNLVYRQGKYVAGLQKSAGNLELRTFDAVVLCTGPNKNMRDNPLIASLITDGTACLDSVGLGLSVDQNSRIVDAQGNPNSSLLAFGPMTRGSFGEMTGAPDIASHIEMIVKIFFKRD